MRESARYYLISSIGVALFTVLTALIAWPIYQTPFFIVTVTVAAVSAGLIAWLSAARRLSALSTTLVALAAIIVLALPVTNPGAVLANPLMGWLEAVTGIVTSWKKLITIDLPVGSYSTLLAPIFLTVFIADLIALVLMWRAPKWFAVGSFVLVFTSMFGIAFGGIGVSPTTVIGPVELPIAPGLIAGLAVLVVTIVLLSWQTVYRRRQSFLTGHTAAQAISMRGGRARKIRQLGTAIGLFLVVAIGVGFVMTASGIPTSREVLRSGITPQIEPLVPVSPLSTYRLSFTDTEQFSQDVLSFTSDDAGTTSDQRIRLAVMPYFDGEAFRVVPPGGETETASAYARIPTDLASTTGSNQVVTTAITINNYDQIWLPNTGDLQNVSFSGARSAQLLNGFYYNRTNSAAIVIAGTGPGLTSGDSYQVRSYLPANEVKLEDLSSQAVGQLIDPAVIPESMATWIQEQNQSTANGTGLKTLIDRLRARGYLSHSLEQPIAVDNQQTWTQTLPGYAFKPSLAGHSTGRLEQLFSQLVEKQNDSPANSTDIDLVAGIGDDEQFAAAVAVMAQSLGYPARVVVGYHTTESKDPAYTIPACENGVCQGKNLSAWVEIQGTNGQWATVDVTPQYKNPITPRTQDRQDPKIPTAVIPDSATELPPPVANPENGQAENQKPTAGIDLSWLWRILQIVLITALIVGVIVSPFIMIIGSKIHRRRERHTKGSTTSRILGAWDEYIDNSVDGGKPLPVTQTRTELASSYATDVDSSVLVTGSALLVDASIDPGMRLANLADRAAFGPVEPAETDVEESWLIVQQHVELNNSEMKIWRKIMTALSLKSFVRQLGPRPVERARQGAFVLATGQTRRASSSLGTFFTLAGRWVVRLVTSARPSKGDGSRVNNKSVANDGTLVRDDTVRVDATAKGARLERTRQTRSTKNSREGKAP